MSGIHLSAFQRLFVAQGHRPIVARWTVASALLLAAVSVGVAAEPASRPVDPSAVPTAPFVLLGNVNKPASVPGKILYADNALTADITDGTYSAEKRAPGGKDGNAYKTIQAAVYTMEPGDMLLLRGGTFNESDIYLRSGVKGPKWVGKPDAWFVVRSYPGEWAVVDGQHREGVDDKGQGKSYSIFRCSGEASFIRFEYFEVCNGGPSDKNKDGRVREGMYDKEIDTGNHSTSGFHFWTGHDIAFDHMVIHGNYGSGAHLGGNGISIQNNEINGAKSIRVTHCYIHDNGWPGGKDGRGVRLFADYRHPRLPEIMAKPEVAMQKNEVAYNLFEDAQIAIYNKATQFLCLTPGDDIHAGTDMTNKDLGDRYHHNIIRRCSQLGIASHQDFAQIYNNIVTDSAAGIEITYPPAHGYREMFHTTVYNNTVLNVRASFCIYKGWLEATYNYLPKEQNYHPFYNMWNNVVVEDGAEGVGAECGPLRILPRYNVEVKPNMDTVHVDNLLVVRKTTGQPAIRVGIVNHSLGEYVAKGWAKNLWETTDSPFQGGEGIAQFLPKKDAVAGGKPLAQAGRGGDHPYLKDVKIPSYLGAVDPANPTWITEVENLKELGKTIKAPPLAEKN